MTLGKSETSPTHGKTTEVEVGKVVEVFEADLERGCLPRVTDS